MKMKDVRKEGMTYLGICLVLTPVTQNVQQSIMFVLYIKNKGNFKRGTRQLLMTCLGLTRFHLKKNKKISLTVGVCKLSICFMLLSSPPPHTHTTDYEEKNSFCKIC